MGTKKEIKPVAWNFSTFDEWYEKHGKHNVAHNPTNEPKRKRELMKLAWEAAREQRASLTDESAARLCAVGAVYAPDGSVTRTPAAYRRELEDATLRGFRLAERAHGIGAKP
jgi:hypothetical protein